MASPSDSEVRVYTVKNKGRLKSEKKVSEFATDNKWYHRFWNRQISFRIWLFIPFLPHLKTSLLEFLSTFFWLLELACNLTTCRSFFTSLSGSISSSVNRDFAILLLTCPFYFCFGHRTHQMKLHSALIWLHVARIRRVTSSVVAIESWSFSSKSLFIQNIDDLIWKRRNKVVDHDSNDLHVHHVHQVNLDTGLKKIPRGWRLYLKRHRTLFSYCSGDALINRRILIVKTRKTDSMSSKKDSSHHLIEVWSVDLFDDRTAKTIENLPDLRQTFIYHLTEWWSFFRIEMKLQRERRFW